MAAGRRLTATLPDGTQATRTTHREYTHVVAVLRESDHRWDGRHTGWGVWSWAGRADLADKAAREAAKAYATVQVVEVDQ